MAKDVNLHLKVTGAEQTKQQLEQTGQAAKQLGDQTAETGKKAERTAGALSNLFSRFAGPLGLLALIASMAKITQAVATFFDTVKQRSDEAVRHLQDIRSGFQDIFEALDAFDERSRQAATKETYELLQKTAVPEAIGLPIIDAYIRQFKGKMPPEQYQQGLETMLSYGVRHGQGATPDLIELMGGWGMNQPEQQAAFTRQIAATSQAVGLTDENLIQALSRGMPTVKAMGWSPTLALEAVATMATGEPSSRMRVGMPAAGLEAIMAPQAEKLAYAEVEEAQRAKSAADKAKAEAARTRTFAAKKAAEQAQADADAKQLAAEQAVTTAEKLAEDPLAFLQRVEEKRSAMTRERYNRLLREIYGPVGGLAVGKLIAERRKDLADIIQRAAIEEGAAADRAEEEQFKSTIEGRDAITKARAKQIELDVTAQEKIMEDVREIGRARYELLGRRKPILMRIRELFTKKLTAAQEEYGARQQWEETLTPEEKEAFNKEFLRMPGFGGGSELPLPPLAEKWRSMTPLEKWQGLTRPGRQAPSVQPSQAPGLESPPPEASPQSQAALVGPVSYNYDHRVIHQTIFNPVVGMNKQDLRIEPPYLG